MTSPTPAEPVPGLFIAVTNITIKDRGRKDLGDVEALANSIREHGLIQPIVVRRPNAGEAADTDYILVAGGRRLAAHIRSGIEHIRAELLGDLPAWRQKALELEENIQRKEMGFLEISEMRLQIHELYSANNPEWQQRDTARIIGHNPSTVARDIRVAQAARLDPLIKQATSRKAAIRLVEHKAFAAAADLRNSLAGIASRYEPIRERLVCAEMGTYLRTQRDASVDLLFSDLPYGIDYFDIPTATNITKGGGHSKFDDSPEYVRDICTDAVPQMIRVTKRTGWLVLFMQWENHFFLTDLVESCCATHYEYADRHDPSKDCRYLHCEPIPWIWYRPNSRNNPERPDLHVQNQYELILVCNMGEAHIRKLERVGNVLAYDSPYDERLHAHQKPAGLCRDVIERCTVAGDTVMDVCFGSGSALREAKLIGREYRGCEKNPNMLDVAIAYVGGDSVPAPVSSDEPADLDAEEAMADG